MTETVLADIEHRKYEHPKDYFTSKPGVFADRLANFKISERQTQLIEELFRGGDKSGVDRCIANIALLATQGLVGRDAQERASLNALGIPVGSKKYIDSGYLELAGNPGKAVDFVIWFDDIARSAMARHKSNADKISELRKSDNEKSTTFCSLSPEDYTNMYMSNAVYNKGFGLEFGSAIMSGDWTYQQYLWRAIDAVSPLLEGAGYRPTHASEEVNRPTFDISRIDTDSNKSWRVSRERGVRNIITPSGDPIWVVHRVVADLEGDLIVNNDEVKNGLRQNVSGVIDSGTRLNSRIGELFEEEIATEGQARNGIIPVSSTVYLRHAFKDKSTI